MSAEPITTTTSPAPEGQANTTPAPVAGEDPAALKAQLDKLLAHKQALEADLKKYRDAKKEAEDRAAAEKAAIEAKLKEQGDHVKLREIAEEKARALEAQLASLAPKAERLTAHETRVMQKLEAAKAKGDLPSFVLKAIDIAAQRDVDEALDILDDYRANQAQPAPKQPAPPAPAIAGAPPSPTIPKRIEQMTPDEILRTPPDELKKMLGKANGQHDRGPLFGRFFAK